MNEEIIHYLKSKGRDISSLRGAVAKPSTRTLSYYWALDKQDSLSFLQLCMNNVTPIIGGDVIKVHNNESLSFADCHWYYDRVDNECFYDYLIHSINRSKEYLQYYSNDDTVLFSFTLLDS